MTLCPCSVALLRVVLSIYFHFIRLFQLCVCANTTSVTAAHGGPRYWDYWENRLISGQARCVHPVWLLSLPRTSKLCGFVGHSSWWIGVRDGACVPRQAFFFCSQCAQLLTMVCHHSIIQRSKTSQDSVLSLNLNFFCWNSVEMAGILGYENNSKMTAATHWCTNNWPSCVSACWSRWLCIA